MKDPFFVSYEDMAEANRSGRLLQRLTNETAGSPGTLEYDVGKVQYRLRQENNQQIAEEFLRGVDRILEIGAGLLDADGRSFLTRCFTGEMASKVFYCDANPGLAEECPDLHCVDIRALSSCFPSGAFSHVIGSNVLDTLSRKDLDDAMSDIKKVLAPGGCVLHLLNYEPYLYAFYADVLSEFPGAVPFVNRQNQHCALITTEEQDSLINLALGLNPEDRQRLWQGILALDTQGYLNNKVSGLQGVAITAFEQFVRKLTEAGVNAGFKEVISKEFVSKREISLPGFPPMHVSCGPNGIENEARGDRLASIEMMTFVNLIR